MKRIMTFFIPLIGLLPVFSSCSGPSGNSAVQPNSNPDQAPGVSAAAPDAGKDSQAVANGRSGSPNRDSNNYRSRSNGQDSARHDNNAPGENHRYDNLNRGGQPGSVPVSGSKPANSDRNSSPNSKKDKQSNSPQTNGEQK